MAPYLPITQESSFSHAWVLVIRIVQSKANNTNLYLTPTQKKVNDKIFRKKKFKKLILSYSGPFSPFFSKNKYS